MKKELITQQKCKNCFREHIQIGAHQYFYYIDVALFFQPIISQVSIMKNLIYVFTFLLLGSLLPPAIYAQCSMQPVSLATQTHQSDYIIEGLVTEQVSFWNNNRNQIYTAYTIEVFKSFKGEVSNYVTLITLGGQVGEVIARVNPSLQLSINNYGLFCCQLSTVNNINLPAKHSLVLQTTAAAQSFYQYEEKKQIAYNHFEQYTDIEKQLYTALSAQLKEHPQIKKNRILENITNINTPPAPQAQQQLISISNLSPLVFRAGMFDTLTISGSGFGDVPSGAAAIKFRHPDYYGLSIAYQSVATDHFISWSDSEIKVIVPGLEIVLGKSGAASGLVKVVNPTGEEAISPQEISILFNKATVGFREVDLVNHNGQGGYNFTYNTNFATNTNAVAAFERALQNWQCNTLSSFVANGNTSFASCPINDNVNLISFDDNCSLQLGVLAQTIHWYVACFTGDAFYSEIDITFSSSDNILTNWNFGPNPTSSDFKDFESICVHELGHAHGMGHVLDYGKLMYPSMASATDIRDIDQDALTCVNHILAHSSQANTCAGSSPVTPTTPCQATLVYLNVLLEGSHNGFNMNTNLKNNNLLPNQQPYNTAPWFYNGTESVFTFPANIVDWILIEVQNELFNISETKAALLRSDGIVVDLSGNEGIAFNQLKPHIPYHIILRHRNHLAVKSSTELMPNNYELSYDFTTAASQAQNSQQAVTANGLYALYAGDCNNDGAITYTDFNGYAQQISPSYLYTNSDINLDGLVSDADFNWHKNNVGAIGIDLIRY